MEPGKWILEIQDIKTTTERHQTIHRLHSPECGGSPLRKLGHHMAPCSNMGDLQNVNTFNGHIYILGGSSHLVSGL